MNKSGLKLMTATGMIVLVALLLSLNANSQSVARQSIASYGSSTIALGNSSVSQTVGQPFNTILPSGGGVSQGFQQAKVFRLVEEKQVTLKELNINIYPNPANSFVVIHSSKVLETGFITVTDANDRVIYEQDFTKSLNHSINCNQWDPGIYVIKVQDGTVNRSIRKLVIAN